MKYSFIPADIDDVVAKYSIAIKKDGKFYVGYCLEIPQARGQGTTKAEVIKDTKRAIKLCKAYLEGKKNEAIACHFLNASGIMQDTGIDALNE